MPTVKVDIPKTAFVSSAQPTGNFSSYPLMYAGTDPGFGTCIGLLQPAIPSLPVTRVDSAVLQLTVIAKSGAAPSTVTVNRVTSAFDTATVTYNTVPSFVPAGSQFDVSSGDLYTTVSANVTALVNDWLNGAVANEGIALTNPDGITAVQFATNAIAYEPYFPLLTITYSDTPTGNDARCFGYAQLANLIRQLIDLYPSATMNIFTRGFNASTVSGTPAKLYAAPDATYGTLAVLGSGRYAAVPLDAIAGISFPDGTAYNPSISYLTPPDFPDGCDKNFLTAYHSYLPVSTSATVYSGALIQGSGVVFKNEYGLLVLADDMTGINPSFIPVFNITAIETTALPDDSTERPENPPLITPGTGPIVLPVPKSEKDQ